MRLTSGAQLNHFFCYSFSFFPCRHSSLTPFFKFCFVSLDPSGFYPNPSSFQFRFFSFITSDSLSVSYFLSIPTLPLFSLFSTESGQHSALLTAARGGTLGRAAAADVARTGRSSVRLPPWTLHQRLVEKSNPS
jgi:hypothetical protein